MERRAAASRSLVVGALAGVLSLTALGGLAACSTSGAGSGSSDSTDVSSQSQTAAPPPPGKFQTLPEPCGSVDSRTLHLLLPSSQQYAGDATLTFDSDLRAGCRWTGQVPGGTRYLSVDFERVVSFDPSVSDEKRAAQLYEGMAAAAHVPIASPASTPSTGASASASPSASGSPAASGSPSPYSSPSVSPSPSVSASTSASASPGGDGSDAPSRIGGVGDEAYLTDVATTTGPAAHRDVTVVFRMANVLVTVVFSQSSTNQTVPPSGDLRYGAYAVAQAIASDFNNS